MKKENTFKSIGYSFLLFMLNAFILAVVSIFSPYSSSAYVVSYTIMIMFLYKFYKRDIIKDFKNLKKDFKKSMKTILPVSILSIVIVYIINAIIFECIGIESGNQLIAKQELKSSVILISIYTILLAPIVEEMMFKMPFKNSKKNRLLHFFIITILFTLLHFYPEDNLWALFYLVSYFILGFSFTYPFYKTNNILMSIIIHIINNLVNVMIILF